jgi:predicted phage terminase large subunit-like protein
MIRNAGGLWDKASVVLRQFGGRGIRNEMRWTFRSGAILKMSHLETDDDRFAWQGAELGHVVFEELTQFSEAQFWYLSSRLRSLTGIPGRMRATCNPDPDSFVARLISWYLDADGYPIPDRSGRIRWFVRAGDSEETEAVYWSSSREALLKAFPKAIPRSFTFIASSLSDNRILTSKDPSYEATLASLPYVDRMRLLHGNWKIRPNRGTVFKREWFEIVDRLPEDDGRDGVRYWDRAATEPKPGKDPDWTRGLKVWRQRRSGVFYVEDLRSIRGRPAEVDALMLRTANQDSTGIPIGLEQDPGAAGVSDIAHELTVLSGYDVRVYRPSSDKVLRAGPASSQAENRKIKVLRAPWNDEFLAELEAFPKGAHDDIVDALSGAINHLSGDTRRDADPSAVAIGANAGPSFTPSHFDVETDSAF